MSLRILIVAGLRVYAIYYATQVLSLLPIMVQMISLERGFARLAGDGLSIGSFALGALILWVFAEQIATAIVGRTNLTVDKFALTLQDAYTFAFVFLGLYFVLSSIAATAAQLYYIVTVAAQMPQDAPERWRALFDIYKPGITLIAGFASLIGAPIWSRRLIAQTQ